MKCIRAVFYFILGCLGGASCGRDKQISEKDLQGTWVLRKALWYADGKEVTYNPLESGPTAIHNTRREQDMEAMWGTKEDPSVVRFTKYREVILGVESAIEADPEAAVHQYEVKEDTFYVLPERRAMYIRPVIF